MQTYKYLRRACKHHCCFTWHYSHESPSIEPSMTPHTNPVGSYHSAFVGYLALGCESCSYKVGCPKRRGWSQSTGARADTSKSLPLPPLPSRRSWKDLIAAAAGEAALRREIPTASLYLLDSSKVQDDVERFKMVFKGSR